jgi:hypothetical protein
MVRGILGCAICGGVLCTVAANAGKLLRSGDLA